MTDKLVQHPMVLYPSQIAEAEANGLVRGEHFIVYSCLGCLQDMDRCKCRKGEKPLTARDLDMLAELEAANRNLAAVGFRGGEGWARPLDCGGHNCSHHSYTLHKLAKRGLCDRKKFGGRRGSCVYRINDAGRALLAKR